MIEFHPKLTAIQELVDPSQPELEDDPLLGYGELIDAYAERHTLAADHPFLDKLAIYIYAAEKKDGVIYTDRYRTARVFGLAVIGAWDFLRDEPNLGIEVPAEDKVIKDLADWSHETFTKPAVIGKRQVPIMSAEQHRNDFLVQIDLNSRRLDWVVEELEREISSRN